MNIIPIKIEFKLLYDNCHLYTDDSHYNSLVVSNLINKKIDLLDFVKYNALDNIKKQYFFDENPRFNYMLSKDIFYIDKKQPYIHILLSLIFGKILQVGRHGRLMY